MVCDILQETKWVFRHVFQLNFFISYFHLNHIKWGLDLYKRLYCFGFVLWSGAPFEFEDIDMSNMCVANDGDLVLFFNQNENIEYI